MLGAPSEGAGELEAYAQQRLCRVELSRRSGRLPMMQQRLGQLQVAERRRLAHEPGGVRRADVERRRSAVGGLVRVAVHVSGGACGHHHRRQVRRLEQDPVAAALERHGVSALGGVVRTDEATLTVELRPPLQTVDEHSLAAQAFAVAAVAVGGGRVGRAAEPLERTPHPPGGGTLERGCSRVEAPLVKHRTACSPPRCSWPRQGAFGGVDHVDQQGARCAQQPRRLEKRVGHLAVGLQREQRLLAACLCEGATCGCDMIGVTTHPVDVRKQAERRGADGHDGGRSGARRLRGRQPFAGAMCGTGTDRIGGIEQLESDSVAKHARVVAAAHEPEQATRLDVDGGGGLGLVRGGRARRRRVS